MDEVKDGGVEACSHCKARHRLTIRRLEPYPDRIRGIRLGQKLVCCGCGWPTGPAPYKERGGYYVDYRWKLEDKKQ